MQSDTYRAVIELPNHADIAAELEKLRFRLDDNKDQRWVEDQDFLRQLSTLEFNAMQKEAYSKRYGSTGQWRLELPEFQNWLDSERSPHSALWCPGNPGVGKTVVTSIAVNHTIGNTGERRSAIVYIYCDYANPLTCSLRNLLGSMVRQLITQTSHAETIAELKAVLKKTTKSRNMTEEELSSWVETFSRTFEVVYTFVDALDECPEVSRDTLLTRLRQYSAGNMRIFLTSRCNVDVRSIISHAIRAEISASSHDIISYVEAKIQKSRRLAHFTAETPALTTHIIQSIVTKADGMFLLAGLQIESLGNQISVQRVRSALGRLPTDIFTMYDQTIERIRDQPAENAELGLKVLSITLGATRPLKTDELRHALAIQPCETSLDLEALVDAETLLSATAGLVITYQDDENGPKFLRLAHYTLQEYLETNQERLFPNLEVDMARTCLSYLCLDEFESGECATDEIFEKRRSAFSFLDYAAHHWDIHLRGVQTELMDQTLAFFQDRPKTAAWLQSFKYNEICDKGLSTSADSHLDPLFLAAHFYLTEIFTRLISARDIESGNTREETPLLRAVDVEPWQKGGEIPFLDFRNAETWQKDGDQPFVGSLDAEQYAMVQMILDLDANIDAKDTSGMTAAFRALKKENCGILALLLDRGADIDARSDTGESLMQVAAKKSNRLDIMHLLLERGADVHSMTGKWESLVHIAADNPTSDMLDYLIDSGASFDTADEKGVTPLMIAADRGQWETLTALIKRGARCDVTDSKQKSPLHFAVSAFSPQPNIVKLVMQTTQNFDVIDIRGRTPLHYAYFRSAQISGDDLLEDWQPEITDVIRLLIEGGASQTIADEYGRIPKDYLSWSHYRYAIDWRSGYWDLVHWESDS